MTLNPDAVGATSTPREFSWTSSDALLYAVGIGAGRNDLAFVTENSIGVEQRVYPTFAVVAGMGQRGPDGGVFSKIGTFDFAQVVHASMGVTLHQPIPVAGTAQSTERVTGMYDKGTAAVVATESTVTLLDGTPLWTTTSSIFIRGAGGFGGERGAAAPHPERPDRQPDRSVTLQTSPDQAYIYRLNGDRNPLHSDPTAATRVGFPGPILHGLCTYGFTARALLSELCGNDPARFRHIEGRFSSPVFAGDELTVDIWELGDGESVFTTSVNDRVVIDRGIVRVA